MRARVKVSAEESMVGGGRLGRWRGTGMQGRGNGGGLAGWTMGFYTICALCVGSTTSGRRSQQTIDDKVVV